jgi:hypothetical protein
VTVRPGQLSQYINYAMGWMTEGLVFNSWYRSEILLLSIMSRWALAHPAYCTMDTMTVSPQGKEAGA